MIHVKCNEYKQYAVIVCLLWSVAFHLSGLEFQAHRTYGLYLDVCVCILHLRFHLFDCDFDCTAETNTKTTTTK